MARKTLKLAWIENKNSRTISLRKRRVGLMKKVKEMSILCDVEACMIIFSPNEAEPMIWPSFEATRGLIDHFFALPELLQMKKEAGLDSYLKEKTTKVHELLMKSHEKNMKNVTDQLMVKLHSGRGIVDLERSEIYTLLHFLRDMLIYYRKMLGFVTNPPLRDPPMLPTEEQFQNAWTTTDDGLVRSDQDDERAGMKEDARRISIGTLMDKKSHYLSDQWVFPPEPPIFTIYQQVEVTMVSSVTVTPNLGRFQGSSSNGNPNLEMTPVDPQLMIFHGFVGSVSQPLQHNNNPNTIVNNDSVPHEPPPNGTTASQDQIEPAKTGDFTDQNI